MSVCSVDDDCVGTCIHESLHAVERIHCHAHSGSHSQSALGILASHGLVLGLGDVLICDESHEVVVLIHHGQFLYLVFLQYLCCVAQVGLLMCGDEVVLRHHVIHLLIEMTLKAQVAVGDDTHKMILVVNNGDTTYMIFSHHVESVLHRRASTDGDRVVDHTVLGTLHDSHLSGLLLDGHVLVNHSDTSLACNGNSHLRFSHGVHCRCDEWHVKRNVTGEHGFQLYRSWQYL